MIPAQVLPSVAEEIRGGGHTDLRPAARFWTIGGPIMISRTARIAFFVFIPVFVFAKQKERPATQLEVITVRTQIHSSAPGDIFTYTNLLFAQVNGKRLVYECAQRGDLCPVMESGKTYTGAQEGAFFYIPMSFPNGQKDLSVRFRQVGSW